MESRSDLCVEMGSNALVQRLGVGISKSKSKSKGIWDLCVETGSAALVKELDDGTISTSKSKSKWSSDVCVVMKSYSCSDLSALEPVHVGRTSMLKSKSFMDMTKDLHVGTMSKSKPSLDVMDIFYPSVPKNKVLGDENSLDLGDYSAFIETKFKEYTEIFSSELARSRSEVSVGEHFDVISRLKSGKEDNYLVRPNREQVSVENSLRGKYILVWCTFLPVLWEGPDAARCRALSDMFSELSATRSDCEMVIVAKMRHGWDRKDVFYRFLSGFPSGCLAVPFEDQKRRDLLCESLGFSWIVDGIFLGPDHRVLQNNLSHLTMWGAMSDAFPFTYDKVMAATQNDWNLLTSCLTYDPSASRTLLQDLLGLPRDYRLQRYSSTSSSSIGRKVSISISQLEESLVGLYLCYTGNLLKMIHKVYQQCEEQRRPFEVVLVYFPGEVGWSLSSFHEFIDSKLNKLDISWWVLPYKNTISRRLWVLCDMHPDDNLIMVGSNGSFLDTHGYDMMNTFGSKAYPFSRDYFRTDIYKRLRNITLRSLLVYESRDYLYRGEARVPVADLEGKDVFLVLDYKRPSIKLPGDLPVFLKEHPLQSVRASYLKLKEREEKKLEVVYVCLCSDYADNRFDVPWLECPYTAAHAELVAERIFINGINKFGPVVAFSGEDGKLCTLFASHLLRSAAASDVSPPLTDRLQEDIDELLLSYDRDLWLPFT